MGISRVVLLAKLPALPSREMKGEPLWLCESEEVRDALWIAGLPAAVANGKLIPGLATTERIAILTRSDHVGDLFVEHAKRAAFSQGFTGPIVAVPIESWDGLSKERLRAAWPQRTTVLPDGETFVAMMKASMPEERQRAGPWEIEERVDAEEEPIEYLVEGLLPVGGKMIVGANKKVGKSIFVLNLAFAVATGSEFLGRRCRQGEVLYISVDEPGRTTKARASAIGARSLIDLVCNRHPQRDWPQALRGFCERKRYALIVVDTLVKLAGIKEINSYTEWVAAYAPLNELSDEFGVAVVVTAHNRKDSASVAGSQAAEADPDTIVRMAKNPDGSRTVETEQREEEDMAKTVISMDRDSYRLRIEGEARMVEQRRVEGLILQALAGTTMTREELRAAVSAKSYTVKKALYALVDAGTIDSTGAGTKKQPKRYFLNDDGPFIVGPSISKDREGTKGPRMENSPFIDRDQAGTNRDQELLSGPGGPRDQECTGPTGTESEIVADDGSRWRLT